MARINRRHFLGITAVAGVGLGLGWKLLQRARNSRQSVSPLAAEGTPTDIEPWLRISPDNVITVTVPRSEMGQGIETALAMIVAEELHADWSLVRTKQSGADPAYGNQHTAASSSVRQMWQPLREVAATARQMLLGAAAETWAVPIEQCTAKDSHLVHPDGRQRLTFGAVAERAAGLPIPENIVLKATEDFTIIGHHMPRLDVPAKVQGATIFGWDVQVPGMLIAAVTRCPVKGGTLRDFDAEKTLQIDGVRAVVPISDPYAEERLLRKAAPYGLAIVADSYWAARRGQDVLEVSWDEGSNSNFDTAAIERLLADWINAGDMEKIVSRGDLNAFTNNTQSKAEASYLVPYLAHVTMSPMCCTADVWEDGCEIWAPTQSPDLAVRMAQKFTGLPRPAITLHKTYIGGGFGRRQRQDYVGEAVQISKAIGKPVKVLSSREEDIQNDFFRPMSQDVLIAWLDDGGYPLGWHHRIASTDSHALSSGGVNAVPYDLGNKSVERARPSIDSPVRVTTWRGVAHSQNAFVIESFIDELAARGDHDPYAYRRHLLRNEPRFMQVLDLAISSSGWKSPAPPGVFRGLAIHSCGGSIAAEIAEISVDAQNQVQVHKITCAVDCGFVVHPGGVEAQLEGAIIDGVTAALHSEITIDAGRVQQSNFHDYPVLRMHQIPAIEIHIVKHRSPDRIGGVGEVGLPPVAPAIANAVFAATGQRIRKLPIRLKTA